MPNPHEWTSVRGAADQLGLSVQQLYRLVADRILTPYRLTRSTVIMLWLPEVEQVAAARRRAGGAGAVRPRAVRR